MRIEKAKGCPARGHTAPRINPSECRVHVPGGTFLRSPGAWKLFFSRSLTHLYELANVRENDEGDE